MDTNNVHIRANNLGSKWARFYVYIQQTVYWRFNWIRLQGKINRQWRYGFFGPEAGYENTSTEARKIVVFGAPSHVSRLHGITKIQLGRGVLVTARDRLAQRRL